MRAGWLAGCWLLALVAQAAPAAAQSDQLARLRDALRRATLNLQALEQQAAADRAQLAQVNATLAARDAELAAATARQSRLEQRLEAAEARGVLLEGTLAAATGRLAAVDRELARSRDNVADTIDALDATEAERAATRTQVAREAELRLACEATNARLFAVGQDLLRLYAGKGVLDALGQREPFTGLKAVELENALQDYEDRLLDERLPPPTR